jgi:periplasmic copper chaperone A
MNTRNEYSQRAAGATAISNTLRGAVMASLLLGLSGWAQAHAVFETKTAPAASYFKGVIGVGHGCDGSPTVLVRVIVPEGFTSIKPMPKPGWTLETKKVPLAKPYESHGKTIKERVGEITWKGGKLDAEHYDEFVLQMRTPEKAGKQYFAVRQECEKGVHDWSEIPAAGKSRRDYKSPAAELDVLPANRP